MNDVVGRFDAAWSRFDVARSGLDPATVTSAGWTVGEMLAHVAFWLETVRPYFCGALRGDVAAFDVTFPSGYVPEQEWPAADVHNAREAAWARSAGTAAVLERLAAAHDDARAFLDTVTEAEEVTHAGYLAEVVDHLDEHRVAELA